VKKIGFLSFGHWTPSPHSQVRSASDSLLQYWGAMGYTWDNPVSRMYRDGRLMSIGGGADEVMLGIICKYMGILPPRHG